MTPSRSTALAAAAFTLAALLAACGDTATLPVAAGTGPEPVLPPPHETLFPTVNIAPATGWPEGGKPVAARGLSVSAFARGLDHPRWLHVLPNGDVLVAETNAPPRGEGAGGGIKAWIAGLVMKRAGAGVPSANRITLLRDADGDGVAELRTPFLEGLNSPFGMALVGNDLYVADTDAVLRFRYAARRDAHHRSGAESWSRCPPARSIITGPRISLPRATDRGCSPRWAPTATSARTAWTRNRGAPRSGKSTCRAAGIASTPRACATRTGWRGSRAAARSGSR